MMNKTCDDIDKYKRRLPAEWENYDAVLMAWPHQETDWAYMLESVQDTVVKIISELIDEGLKVILATPCMEDVSELLVRFPKDLLFVVEVPTNDTWARDFGVITCKDIDGNYIAVDFAFNGWGLKFPACKDNLVTSFMHRSHVIDARYENRLGFVLEGGSIESDGNGTILTTSECLMSPNRNGDMSREQIESYLEQSLGARRVLWLDYGFLAGDDTDSHIDTLARLVSEDTIVYVKCDDRDDEHYRQLSQMEKQLTTFTTSDGRPYNLVGLPMPAPVYDEDGNRLPATYANFLITPRSVLLPIYGQPHCDELARQIMKVVFPDREIRTVDCTSLIQQHGSLHCMTMQIPHFVL